MSKEYLNNKNQNNIFIVNVFFTLMVLNFAISCSLREPGIVTPRTVLFQNNEEDTVP